jgi:hypothetical protein
MPISDEIQKNCSARWQCPEIAAQAELEGVRSFQAVNLYKSELGMTSGRNLGLYQCLIDPCDSSSQEPMNLAIWRWRV